MALCPVHAAGLTIDSPVTVHQTSPSKTITSPAFSTHASNELLLAFLTSDGPASARQTFASLTANGLSWRLRQRANTQAGTAEIWQAVAANPLTNVIVTATRSSGSFVGSLTLVAFQGANTIQDGASAGASAASGAPSATLTTTQAGSWVWGVGNDWDRAAARTVGSGQTKVDEYLASVGDTFWVQSLTSPTPVGGSVVTISDTAPTNDRWNLAIIEILPQ
jgi:hypothetical protein